MSGESASLTWRNFPGVVEQGRRDARLGVTLPECQYDVGTPKHAAWVRGWAPETRRLAHLPDVTS